MSIDNENKKTAYSSEEVEDIVEAAIKATARRREPESPKKESLDSNIIAILIAVAGVASSYFAQMTINAERFAKIESNIASVQSTTEENGKTKQMIIEWKIKTDAVIESFQVKKQEIDDKFRTLESNSTYYTLSTTQKKVEVLTDAMRQLKPELEDIQSKLSTLQEEIKELKNKKR